jgi:magnesium-transporting ATPase (P-type)
MLPMEGQFKGKEVHIDRNGYQFIYKRYYKVDTLILDYTYMNKRDEISGAETNQYVKDYAAIDNFTGYSISWNSSASDETLATSMNVSTFVFAFFVAGVAICSSIYIYTRRSIFDIQEILTAKKIGGWLIVIAIIISTFPLVTTYSLLKSPLFDQSTWDNLELYEADAIYWKLLLFLETLINTSIVVFSLLSVFLFFERRKIFPKFFVTFRLAWLTLIIVDMLLVSLLRHRADEEMFLPMEYVATCFRIIIDVIWIAYMLKSTRVKQTFVFTYPSVLWKTARNQEFLNKINLPFPQEIANANEAIFKIPEDENDKKEN